MIVNRLVNRALCLAAKLLLPRTAWAQCLCYELQHLPVTHEQDPETLELLSLRAAVAATRHGNPLSENHGLRSSSQLLHTQLQTLPVRAEGHRLRKSRDTILKLMRSPVL